MELLHEMGHPTYHADYFLHLECSSSLPDVEQKVQMAYLLNILPFFNHTCR